MQEKFVLRDRQEKLAHFYVEEYLATQGVSFETLFTLPIEQTRKLMVQASIYASVKLAELDDRAEMVTSLHHVTDSV